ncbi:unnamed protein product [Adineta steineri]|uniref:G-protein coupled receptors family 1 profile domain-containing protein n=1 Tax=Adineta steineri TaxID=433720 RepID=A0A814V8Q2_9BILA|nr:unnamed protein product [Adineta steineri]CAF1185729.1 unnamed protein product [Adineta steineri]
MWHDAIRLGLVRIFYPCLMIFGTIGNVLCLKILLRKRFRRQSTCQYLCILAVIDILFIYTRSARYLYRYIYNLDLRNRSLWICRSYIFFSSTLSQLASWILVVVSFDRYFIIINKLSYRHAGWRVMKTTFILIFIICLLNIHYFFILGTDTKSFFSSLRMQDNTSNETFPGDNRFLCMAHPKFQYFFHLYQPIFDLLFVAIIPFLLMIFTNLGIICTTMKTNALRITSRRQKRNNRLTIMLLSVILTFILLTCPSVILICLNRLMSYTIFSNTELLILDLLESLWYTKHALNFILYTLSGQDFRREFCKLISCSKQTVSDKIRNRRQCRRGRESRFSMSSYASTHRTSLIVVQLNKTKTNAKIRKSWSK